MPPVRAPRGGNIFSDLGTATGGLISGSLERQQREREAARQAALDADKFESTAIQRAIADAQIGLQGAQQTELERRPEVEALEKAQRKVTAEGIVNSMPELTPARRTALIDFFVENERFPPGMDITPPLDRQADAISQLGFKADIKRKFLIALSGDNVLELTNQDLISQADSEIRRLVQTNPGADFELIQSTVIDELEKALKALEQKKAAAAKSAPSIGGQAVTIGQEDDIINRNLGAR